MPLFDQEDGSPSGGPDAAQRMFWTREGGTRRLIVGFVTLVVVWFVIDKVRDHFLLATQWKPLTADVSGLTVVGTLDARGNYDRNMFRVVQASKEFRVEITDFGWRSIFDEKNGGKMFTEANANAIKRACDLDGQIGDAMLEPYLRAGVAQVMGRSDWARSVDPNMPIEVDGAKPGENIRKGTLGELIDRYSKRGGQDREQKDNGDAGGTGATQNVEHGMAMTGTVLARSCPIVLTSAQFNGAYLEEQPATLVGGKTWTLHLGLTPEGRSRFYQWSHDHANENLIFILNREVLAAGRIAETLDVNEWGLGPLHDEQSAKQLEAYVNRTSKGK